MRTLLETITKAEGFLAGKGIANARVNAELLIGHALGLKRAEIYSQGERLLSDREAETIRALLRRRGQREPMQYIFGQIDFFGLRIATDRRALIPRPRTEDLVAAITTRLAKSQPASILELGTGCGAIALALAKHWPQTNITATDIDDNALALAKENAVSLGVEGQITFIQSDWFAMLSATKRFDLIVANPPYLSDEEAAALEADVRQYEPGVALSAGITGLEAIDCIITNAGRFLEPGGLLAMEIGDERHGRIIEKLRCSGFNPDDTQNGKGSYVFARNGR